MIRTVMCLALIFTLTGCGEESTAPVPDKIVPVTGVVTMDGKPLDFARVTFVPQGGTSNQGFGGTGGTDSTGKYELKSLIGQEMVVGAPPGNYKVVLSRMVKRDGTVMSPDSMEPPMNSAATQSVPMRYAGTATTPLSVDVSTSGGTYNFDIKSR